MHQIIEYIILKIGELGYTGIIVMMTLESSFFPFPSEVAMIPAGYLSSIGEMNFILALLSGTIGALLGASINYLIGIKLGGPIIKSLINKYGKYIFIKIDHYNKSEEYFKNHGSITTLIARFIPAVRQLISLPAGVFKMNYFKFLLYTGIGATIWNLVLMSIGYIAGENRELIQKYSSISLLIILIIIIILGISYYYYNINGKKKL